MTALESPDYQVARDRIKGNPVISMMAAGVATVPLAELAHEDGTPRFAFLQHANRAFDQAESQNAGNPRYQRYPADAPRQADRRGGARRARSDPGGGRVRHGRTRHRPGVRRRDPDHRAAAGRRVTGIDRPRDGSPPVICTATTETILLCDGCFQAATGLLAECEDGCPQDLDHTGLCLRASPDQCQWCGTPAGSAKSAAPTSGTFFRPSARKTKACGSCTGPTAGAAPTPRRRRPGTTGTPALRHPP